MRAMSYGGRGALALRGLVVAAALVVAACNQPAATQRPTRPTPHKSSSASQLQQEEGGAWLTFGGDPTHASVNNTETAITAVTVSQLHRSWHVQLSDLADERPIMVRNLTMPDGQKHDVLYVTTDAGTLMAIDADSGHTFWAVTPRAG